MGPNTNKRMSQHIRFYCVSQRRAAKAHVRLARAFAVRMHSVDVDEGSDRHLDKTASFCLIRQQAHY